MPDKMYKLNTRYGDLLIEVWETQIKVVDSSRHSSNQRITMFYGDLLEFGTVVYYKSRLWFFSKPSNQGILHGVWTNEDGETKNTYDFLIDIFNYTGPTVELVLDPRRFIPKEV